MEFKHLLGGNVPYFWHVAVEICTHALVTVCGSGHREGCCVGVYWAEKRRLGGEDCVQSCRQQSCRHKSMVPLGNKVAKSSHTGFM